jgi:hypothetical protein
VEGQRFHQAEHAKSDPAYLTIVSRGSRKLLLRENSPIILVLIITAPRLLKSVFEVGSAGTFISTRPTMHSNDPFSSQVSLVPEEPKIVVNPARRCLCKVSEKTMSMTAESKL